MRVAIFLTAGALAFASLPAIASPSCMTQAEARAKFPTQHLWWHGPNRCWDATPNRRQLAKRIEAKKEASIEPRAEPEALPEAKKACRIQRATLARCDVAHAPEDFAGSLGPARAEASADPSGTPAPPRMNFFERWVDIVQRAPPLPDKAAPGDLAADARSAEPLVTPRARDAGTARAHPHARLLRAFATTKQSQSGLARRTVAQGAKAAHANLALLDHLLEVVCEIAEVALQHLVKSWRVGSVASRACASHLAARAMYFSILPSKSSMGRTPRNKHNY